MKTYEHNEDMPELKLTGEKHMLNEGPLGVSPDAAKWRHSAAGRDYLAGNNGNTIVRKPID